MVPSPASGLGRPAMFECQQTRSQPRPHSEALEMSWVGETGIAKFKEKYPSVVQHNNLQIDKEVIKADI
jgi:hypothetical protein